MKNLWKILITCLLMISAAHTGNSQTIITKADSLRLMERNTQKEAGKGEQARKSNSNTGTQQPGRNNQTRSVKRIRGGRPDMTRARGARPPSVVRPSGSGIPKGVGKPGGAGRKGGR